MTTPRNLHAFDNFKKGDKGSVKTHHVSRRDGHAAWGARPATALQDVDAGKNGWFEDIDTASSGASR
jgi:hypothetical protein